MSHAEEGGSSEHPCDSPPAFSPAATHKRVEVRGDGRGSGRRRDLSFDAVADSGREKLLGVLEAKGHLSNSVNVISNSKIGFLAARVAKAVRMG